MLSLSSTLLSAQKGRGARPCVEITVDDRHVGVGRLRPAAVYAGTEDDGPCAFAYDDGYLLRARVDDDGDLYFARTDGKAVSGWDGWTLLAAGVSTEAQVALAAAGDGRAYLLYAGGSGGTLFCRRSQDGGVNWATAEVVFQADVGCRITSVAAVCPTAHDCLCLIADDGQTQDPDDLVYAAWLEEGQWQSAVWPRDAGDASAGLAAVSVEGNTGYSRVHFVLCGAFEETNRPAARLYQLQLTAEGLRMWVYRGAVLVGDAPGCTWSQPALAAAGDRPRLFLRQNTGSDSRLGHLFLMRLSLVGPVSAGDFVPLAEGAAGGVGAAAGEGEIFFGGAARVWRSPLYTGASGQRVDVSADVSSYRAERSRRRASEMVLVLDDDGRYGAGEAAGAVLRPGGQVCLREGYITAAGEEWTCRGVYWIEEVLRRQGKRPEVVLRAYDGWGKLWRARADRAHEWQTSPANVLAEGLERFGFVYSDDGSLSLYSPQTPPRFSLGVGQSWGGLLERVLDYCGCEVRFYTDPAEEETWPSARAHVFTPADTVEYAYGADHPLLESALSEREREGTWVQVLGEGVFGEALDGEAIAAMGYPAVVTLVDARLHAATDVTAEAAAGFALRRGRWAREGEWLRARPNVGQELLDVVSVGEEARRVLRIETRFDRRLGVYEQRLGLGGV